MKVKRIIFTIVALLVIAIVGQFRFMTLFITNPGAKHFPTTNNLTEAVSTLINGIETRLANTPATAGDVINGRMFVTYDGEELKTPIVLDSALELSVRDQLAGWRASKAMEDFRQAHHAITSGDRAYILSGQVRFSGDKKLVYAYLTSLEYFHNVAPVWTKDIVQNGMLDYFIGDRGMFLKGRPLSFNILQESTGQKTQIFTQNVDADETVETIVNRPFRHIQGMALSLEGTPTLDGAVSKSANFMLILAAVLVIVLVVLYMMDARKKTAKEATPSESTAKETTEQ